MGNLTRDPELRNTQTGTTVVNISIAVGSVFYDKNGNKQDEVCFIECVAFGRVAENIAKFFNKGKPILIEGRLKLDQWEDKETGKKRSKHVGIIESFQFVGGKQNNSTEDTNSESNEDFLDNKNKEYKHNNPTYQNDCSPSPDDDIPF